MKPTSYYAKKYAKARFSPIPISLNGSKKPRRRWKTYQHRIATPEQIDGWGEFAIGIVCGAVSGNLEAVDIDASKLIGLVSKEIQANAPDIWSKLTRIQTPRPGLHLLYRHEGETEASQDLACRPWRDDEDHAQHDECKLLIETRGEGAYILAPHSPAKAHQTLRTYQHIGGPKFSEMSVLTIEERQQLLDICRRYNEVITKNDAGVAREVFSELDPNRPGDDFELNVSWDQILLPKGWTRTPVKRRPEYWRPGKQSGGCSATVCQSESGRDTLCVFSRNADKLAPVGKRQHITHTKFHAYSVLYHEGDHSDAAVHLGTEGFAGLVFGEQLDSDILPIPESGISPFPWPDPLDSEAKIGIGSEFLNIIGDKTEADEAAILLTFLCGFGNLVGRSAFVRAERDQHHARINPLLVGPTGRGRKGVSLGYAKELFRQVDPEWAEKKLVTSLSSGEGLIKLVRDPVIVENEDGEPEVKVPGVEDKRLWVTGAEYAVILQQFRREGNTLSAFLRMAWDGDDLSVPTKQNALRATRPHISILGHITWPEMLRLLSQVEAHNGSTNRMLIACVRRARIIPRGGDLDEVALADLAARLQVVVDAVQSRGELKLSPQAAELWDSIYRQVTVDDEGVGLYQARTARAEAHLLRLSLAYALLDRSKQIQRKHLDAAMGVWRYCRDSIRHLYGDQLGDKLADNIVTALRDAGGTLGRTEIHKATSRHATAVELNRALKMLQACDMIERSENDRKEEWRLVQ